MRFRPVLALLPLLAAPPAAAGSAGPDLPAGSAGPGLPAVPALAGPERERGLDCLALAIVHEAGQEPRAGQEAVAEVVLNRLAHPAYPKSICAVVFAGADRATGCQFSFTCDGSLRRVIAPARLAAARAVAAAVLDGRAVRHVPGATHYHASYVAPRWAPGLVRLSGIGQHIFYRRGDGGAAAPAPAQPGPAAPTFAPWGLASAS